MQMTIDEMCKDFGFQKENVAKELNNSVGEILKFILAESELMSNLPNGVIGRMSTLIVGVAHHFLEANKEILDNEEFNLLINNFRNNINAIYNNLS